MLPFDCAALDGVDRNNMKIDYQCGGISHLGAMKFKYIKGDVSGVLVAYNIKLYLDDLESFLGDFSSPQKIDFSISENINNNA